MAARLSTNPSKPADIPSDIGYDISHIISRNRGPVEPRHMLPVMAAVYINAVEQKHKFSTMEESAIGFLAEFNICLQRSLWSVIWQDRNQTGIRRGRVVKVGFFEPCVSGLILSRGGHGKVPLGKAHLLA